MLVRCSQCGKDRELKKPSADICKNCSNRNRRIDKTDDGTFHHTCIDCMTEWETASDTRAQRCRVCQGKRVGMALAKFNTKPIEEHIRYIATCTECGSVRHTKSNPKNRKTTLCGSCNRRSIGRANKKQTVAEPKVVREVKTKPVKAKAKVKKVKKPKKVKLIHHKNKVSEESIKLERERNREHREAQAKKPVLITQTKTPEELIKEFLEVSKPSVVAKDEPFAHVMPSGGLCKGGYLS